VPDRAGVYFFAIRTKVRTIVTQTILPPRQLAWLLPIAAAMLLSIPSTHAQVEHRGPAASIALSKTLAPYDVSTVKQNISGDGSYGWGIHNDGFTANEVTLKQVLELAYDIKEDQILGLTGPIGSAHFDIVAKVLAPDAGKPPDLTDAQLAAMLIPLFADRFHLQAHLETKTLPVYDLVVAHDEPKFQLSQAEPTTGDFSLSWAGTDRVLSIKSCSMVDLAAALSDQVHRKVIDTTGLAGRADITLKWSDDVAAKPGGDAIISIFAAVEEQLGLKLQSAKGPVDTLVIDHIEMPSDN
jgi:bla regulator protein BlaR1